MKELTHSKTCDGHRIKNHICVWMATTCVIFIFQEVPAEHLSTGKGEAWDAMSLQSLNLPQLHHGEEEQDHLPEDLLRPLLRNSGDYKNPEFWMSGEGDVWLGEIDKLASFIKMDKVHLPMHRITKKSDKSLLMRQTKRDNTFGRKVDGRIRILKKSQEPKVIATTRTPRSWDVPRILQILDRGIKRVEFAKGQAQRKIRSDPVRLTRLLKIQKALKILGF